uniref:Uncharacterized protein n=1 Tax=Anguilla anguilla TaxID=7936 RepID=A0A0E9U3B1_ANGAN
MVDCVPVRLLPDAFDKLA